MNSCARLDCNVYGSVIDWRCCDTHPFLPDDDFTLFRLLIGFCFLFDDDEEPLHPRVLARVRSLETVRLSHRHVAHESHTQTPFPLLYPLLLCRHLTLASLSLSDFAVDAGTSAFPFCCACCDCDSRCFRRQDPDGKRLGARDVDAAFSGVWCRESDARSECRPLLVSVSLFAWLCQSVGSMFGCSL